MEQLEMRKLKRHAKAEERRRSAYALVEGLLTIPDLCKEHRLEFIKLALWKVTEAEWGRRNTRFCSMGVLSNPRHKREFEHVWERAKMAQELIQHPELAAFILEKAVTCTVTKEEHEALTKVGCELSGWDRYKAAGIEVWDREAEAKFDLTRCS
jgi:hypothetical protein